MTTTTDDELLALAEAATPGRWHVNPHDDIEVRTETHDARGGYYQTVCETYNAKTAAYIAAASPERVKALVMRARELEDTAEGLTADLQLAVEVAFKRGAREWARLNYPKEYARLVEGETASGDTQAPLLNADDTQAAYFNPAGEGE